MIAPEICVSQQVVQVVREELEHKAEVVAPREVVLQPDDVELVRGVGSIHQLEKPDLDLGLRNERGHSSGCSEPYSFNSHLVKERFLILDDLDGHVTLLLVVISFDDLPEGALADEGVDLVAVEEALPGLDDVVVVFVVVTLQCQNYSQQMMRGNKADSSDSRRCRASSPSSASAWSPPPPRPASAAPAASSSCSRPR